MLYGADANKLPYSRFKRISTPEKPLLKSLAFALWGIASVYLFLHPNDFHNSEILSFSWLGWVSLVLFVISLSVVVISEIYKASFGLSLKKLSLKNAEIETGELSENSTLNRHLDEIIYFFQATNYDVVVIEDLDRFGDPEIFVKLREINKLINDNEKTRGQVKFLYALKDDMFVHKDRAKFFDFIIPVVPIINSSNSLEKIQEHLKKHDFAKSIDAQFLREVSLYIDDLRLIHNIFNEFIIYYENLKSESLDVTKLLAMMIYKNVYPDDFENLHHGKGIVFDICKKRNELFLEANSQLKERQRELRESLESANTESSRSVRGLISTYIGHIVIHANRPVLGIVCNNQHRPFSHFTTFDNFKPLANASNIELTIQQSNHPSHRIPINKSFSKIEEEINPGETFLDRMENIENKRKTKQIEIKLEIQGIDSDIIDLSKKQLFQILQSSDCNLEELIDGHKIPSGELLVYLIKNGYLDDNYHLYISNFHEGRLTKNDRDYILSIRNFNQPDPNQKIDTPEEVCADMRGDDFGHQYVLNVTLIDYLLENHEISLKRIKSAVCYISRNFEQSEEFFTAYYILGKKLDKFICHLSHEWPGFSSMAISSINGAEHVAYILKFVEAKHVCDYMNEDNLLRDYLSEQGHLVLASNFPLPDDYDVLKKLGVRFHDLASLDSNHTLIGFSHAESLYVLNSENVNYIFQSFSDEKNMGSINSETANYTSILAAGSESLKEYIAGNLATYIEDVFLVLPENTEESEGVIKALINNEMINDDLKERIISKQGNVFETFEAIPENLWKNLLLEEKVIISWGNISEYLNYENGDKAVVTKLLGRENIVNTLAGLNISEANLGEEESKSLSRFILENGEIKDSDYCKLIAVLPYWYHEFPTEISKEKIEILAKERRVRLTGKSFSFAENDNQLIATLISKNFNKYLEEKENYPINNDVRKLLLESEISDENKITVCFDVIPSGITENTELSRLITNLLVSNEVDCSEFDVTVLKSAIVNAQTPPNSIQLLMKCLPTWTESQTMEVLADLPSPFNEISSYGKRPQISNNKLNLEFSKLLKERDFISTVKAEDRVITINTYKSSDHSKPQKAE